MTLESCCIDHETTPCARPVSFRFTWPGAPEKFVCATHARALATVAQALGFMLELIVVYHDSEGDADLGNPQFPEGHFKNE